MNTPSTRSDPLLHLGVIVLALGTAITHLLLNFPDAVFILNGLGYLALLAALYAPIRQLVPYRSAARVVLIGYTALTIVLWIVFGARSPIGFINKTNELLLILLLVLQARRR